MKSSILSSALGTLATLVSQLSLATDQQEQTFDRELMTPAELEAYRAQLRVAGTEEERERIHQEHHDLIVARARARGIPLDYPGATPR